MASTAGRLDIYNMALGFVGTRTVSSPNEQTPEAIQCELYWDRARRAALRDFPYNFASRRALLASKTLPQAYSMQWAYAYALPANCLKVVHVHDGNHPNTPFRIVQTANNEVVILSNVANAYADYTVDVEDITLWDELFVLAMARKLAAMIATPLLKNNPQKQQQLEQLYQMSIPSLDGQDASEVELSRSVGNMSTWLMARGIVEEEPQAVMVDNQQDDRIANAQANEYARSAAEYAVAADKAREQACACATRAEVAAEDAETKLAQDVALAQQYSEVAAAAVVSVGSDASLTAGYAAEAKDARDEALAAAAAIADLGAITDEFIDALD